MILRAEVARALRYALAPACVGAAVVLHLSPAGPYLHTTGLLLLGVVAAAWFGGLGPGLLAALLATLVFHRLTPMNYPLLADFFDVPRFITFTIAGAAVGWGNRRRRLAERKRAEIALRQSEQRHALAMEAAGDGHTDWNVVTGEFYVSPRLLGIVGFAPGTTFADRAEWVRRFPFHPEDRERWQAAVAAHFASREAKFKMDLRIIVNGETRWVAFTFIATRDAAGKVVRWTGSIADISDAKRDVATVLDTIPGLVAMLTPAGEVEAVNNQLAEYCGQPLEAMRQWGTNGTVHAEDLPRVADLFMRAITAGEPYDFEARIRRCDGVYRWNQVRGSPSRDSGGRILRWYVVLSDIDDRKRAEEALRESEKRYERVMLAADAGFWDWDAARDEFHASPRLLEMSGLPPGTKLAGREDFLRRAAFHPEDRTRWQQAVKELFTSGGSRVAMEVRSIIGGKTTWHRLEGMCFRDEAGRVVRWTGSSTYIDERKRAEEALREQTLRYERVTMASNAGLWDWDVEKDEFYASPRYLEMCGFPPGATFSGRMDFLRRSPIHPEDREEWMQKVRQLFESGDSRVTMEQRVLIGGETRWIFVNGICFRDASGRVVRWTGSATDVTERKRAEQALRLSEEALRQSEERYTVAVDGANQGIFDWDLQNDRVFHSRRAQELFGLEAGESWRPRREWAAMIRYHPEDLPGLRTRIHCSLNGETPTCDGEYRIVPREGEVRWLHQRGVVLRDASGKAYRMAGSIEDVTERKVAVEALRESEMRFRALTELWSDWYWRQDEALRFTYSSAQGGWPDGSSRTPAIGLARWEIPGVVPLSSSWAEHRQLLAEHKPFRDFEYGRPSGDGAMRYVSSSGTPIFDDKGEFRGYQGVARDITERKRAEEGLLRSEAALRLSEERYALALEASEEGHFDTDLDTDQTFVSARLAEIYGFARQPRIEDRIEWIKKIPFHPDDRHVLADLVRPAWEDSELPSRGDLYEFEYRIVVCGETRWVNTRGMVTRDAEGCPRRRIGVVADITARKIAEKLLSGEKRVLERVAKGEPLQEVLDDLCRLVEELAPGVLASILLLDGNRLRHGGAPSLPKAYTDLIDGAAIGPSAGSCGTAAYRGQQVIVSDIATDALWADYRALALPHGLRACWSTPVLSPEGKVIATFAMYYREPRSPAARDQQIIEQIGHLAGVAIQHKLGAQRLAHSEKELRLSDERYALAMEASEEGHFDWNVQTDEIFASEHLKKLLELPVGREYRTRNDMVSRMPFYPGDAAQIAGMARKVLAGDALQHEFEYRLIRRGEQEPRWIHARWKIIRSQDAAAQRVIGVISDITERKRAEEALRRSQQYLAEAQSLSHIGSWAFNADGFQYWSAELFRIHGLDPGGKAPSIPEYLALVHPEDRDSVVREIERILAGAPGFDFKKRIVRPDGEIRLVRCVGIRAATGGMVREFVGSGMDVTEQERAEEGLRKSEERFALAVAGSNEGIFDWDLAGDRVYVSLRAQELFRLPAGDAWRPRREWRNILNFHPDDRSRQHDAIKALIEGRGPLYDEEFRIILADNSVRWFRQRGIALPDAAGKVTRMVGSIGDITDRKVAQEELLRLERQLRQAQRLESLGTLAGGIAHDFNNILGAIVGYGEMALRGAKNGTRLRRDLDAIMSAGERGRTLVDRILAFSRSGVVERLPVHVEEVVREALDQLAAKLPQNVTIEPCLRAGRAAMLGDSTQVHQVVMNLARNGVQAMPGGGVLRVTLEILRSEAERAATVGALAPCEYIVLKVGDAGTGIPPAVLERMFDPFFTTKEGGVGTGLGLSLVHGIVANVGGAIDVATEIGAGSTFTVYLRRSGDAPEKVAQEKLPLPRGEGQRVLVVDDEEPLVRLATETLQNLGYAPVAFTSSTAALAAFRADPQRFDAVLTDERMPGMSGSALIREVRGIRDAIPVVLMSGYLGMQSVDADVVVRKPVSAGELAASLARALHS